MALLVYVCVSFRHYHVVVPHTVFVGRATQATVVSLRLVNRVCVYSYVRIGMMIMLVFVCQ